MQTSHLPNLPSELLLRIASYVLYDPSEKPVSLRSAGSRRWSNEVYDLTGYNSADNFGSRKIDNPKRYSRVTKSKLLNCLLICRRFYFSGVEAFFGGRTFSFQSLDHLVAMLKKVDTDRRRHITDITIGIKHSEMHTATGIRVPWISEDDPRIWDVVSKLPALKLVTLELKSGLSASSLSAYVAALLAQAATLREMVNPVQIRTNKDDVFLDA